MIVLKNAAVFDGQSDTLLKGCSVIVDHGRIIEVREQDKKTGWQLETIDLQGCTLLPGLIDCHMHLLLYEVPDRDIQFNDRTPGGGELENGMAYLAFRGAHTAKKVLLSGFTTVFDGGGAGYVDLALRDAIAQGIVEGPSAYVCGKQITAGRSHFPGLGLEALGADGMRGAVRTLLWHGVNHIKIKMSAPMRMPGRNTERSEFTMPELRAAVEEAHSAGLSVSVHARGAKPILDSLHAGVDRIVHGTGIDDDCIDFMLKHGIFLYPTLHSPPREPSAALAALKTPQVLESIRRKGQQHFESVKKAYHAGVRLAFSTDSGIMGVMAGDNARELLCMRELGMGSLEILRSATSDAAEAVGLADRIGRVQAGYDADLIAVRGDPLQTLESILDTQLIMKNGRIVKNTLPMEGAQN